MRPSLYLFKGKKSGSSQRWLQRQSSDPYVRMRKVVASSSSGSGFGSEGGGKGKERSKDDAGISSSLASVSSSKMIPTHPTSISMQASPPSVSASASASASPSPMSPSYRSRSAFKLVSLSSKYPSLLRRGARVVDLGAAPGGWSQVASRAVGFSGRVVGIDLLRIEPLGERREQGGGDGQVKGKGKGKANKTNTVFVQGDFLAKEMQDRLVGLLERPLAPVAAVATDGTTTMEVPPISATSSYLTTTPESAQQPAAPAASPFSRPSPRPAHATSPTSHVGYNPRSSVGTGTGVPLVDTILSDMMANMSGVRDRDVSLSLELCESALVFAERYLKVAARAGASGGGVVSDDDGKDVGMVPGGERRTGSGNQGGSLVMKFFQHPDFNTFMKERLQPVFAKVRVEKPKESRSESSEAYFVCLGFKGKK